MAFIGLIKITWFYHVNVAFNPKICIKIMFSSTENSEISRYIAKREAFVHPGIRRMLV